LQGNIAAILKIDNNDDDDDDDCGVLSFLSVTDVVVFVCVQLDVGLSRRQLATASYRMLYGFSSSVLAKS